MTSRRIAVALAAVAFGSTVVAMVLLAVTSFTPVPTGSGAFGFPGAALIFACFSGAVGLAIAYRQSHNHVAWIFLAAGVCGAGWELSKAYAVYAIVNRGGRIPGGEWAAWIAQWLWLPMLGAMLLFMPLFFPDGRLLSRRWRPVAWYGGFATALFVLAVALEPGWLLVEGTYVRNPTSPFRDGAFSFADVQPWGNAVLLPATIVTLGALVLRFRRSRGAERQQMKWLAYASAVVVAVTLLVPVLQTEKPYQIVGVLIINAIPLAVGIAILRYRLYDIDLLINRTLVYGATSAAIAATFSVGLVALQPLLRALTAGNDLAVAAATLVSFALFQPLRGRVQDAVDRRFGRSRYDAARTLDSFADRLRDEVDLDALHADLIGAVRQTMGPVHTSLWLRKSARRALAESPPPRSVLVPDRQPLNGRSV
jgi:hypothetical protein